jgi:hypothetical protein
MNDNYDGPAMAQQILRLQAERDALKAEVERLNGVTRSGSGTATYTDCLACGIGAVGKAYGYVCPRQDCPIRINYVVLP